VATFVLGSIVVVFLRADALSGLGPADWAAVRFTVLQALLSSAASILLAVPVARALSRRDFRGRGVLITLLGAPFILPVIVAVLGLVAVFGQDGALNTLIGQLGLDPLRIYGLQGVVLAHVFFNLPLATRFILQGWQTIPAERFRLAASLGLGPAQVFRLIEMPMLKSVLPGAALVVFLVCLTSFAVALTLGGRPRATTIELAIFQSFSFDFDLARAALLAVVQVALTLGAAALAYRIAVPVAFGPGLGRPIRRWEAGSAGLRMADGIWIGAAATFLLVPLVAVVLRGAPGLADLSPQVWHAALRSVLVALASAGLTAALALSLASGIAALQALRPRASAAMEAAGYLTIAASPLVIGTGLFIVVFPVADPGRLALPVTALVNALMSLPFALRALAPAVADLLGTHRRLAESLDMPRSARIRLVYLPLLRAPLGFALGLAAALSMGDLGVIALFADPEAPTLPLQVYRLMAAYRMEDAAGAALLLVALSLLLFWVFDRGGRANA
jgi:thiamine transport system permease protein